MMSQRRSTPRGGGRSNSAHRSKGSNGGKVRTNDGFCAFLFDYLRNPEGLMVVLFSCVWSFIIAFAILVLPMVLLKSSSEYPPSTYFDRLINGNEPGQPDPEWMQNHAAFKTELMTNDATRSSMAGLERVVRKFNELPVRNKDKFTLRPDHIPVLILVHTRAFYLERAVELYRGMTGIESTMLIISHDGLYPEVTKVIDSIDFCQVKELIFPYHFEWLQKISKRYSRGHPLGEVGYHRTMKGSLKLHWVWANTRSWEVVGRDPNDGHPLFDELCYMEDDYFPSLDFLQTLHGMKRIRDAVCDDTECFGSVIGRHTFKVPGPMLKKEKVSLVEYDCPRKSLKSLTGFSWSRSQWTFFHDNIDSYCGSKTRHWDDSLYQMMAEQRLPPMYMKATFPRALHLGRCGGIHYKGKDGDNCTAASATEGFNFFIGDRTDMRREQYHLEKIKNPNRELYYAEEPPRRSTLWRERIARRKKAEEAKLRGNTTGEVDDDDEEEEEEDDFTVHISQAEMDAVKGDIDIVRFRAPSEKAKRTEYTLCKRDVGKVSVVYQKSFFPYNQIKTCNLVSRPHLLGLGYPFHNPFLDGRKASWPVLGSLSAVWSEMSDWFG
eukprot:TRINITY_DN4720_c0_g1_i1.p1 TRINITY_DN4720_c0_g1~~TRINITY_DN4720_c0_g1_i1.p1  ORF type:complete len:605 (-),score=105.98 TRINITY_DN4720_c0_g1_i1:4-1818(-)